MGVTESAQHFDVLLRARELAAGPSPNAVMAGVCDRERDSGAILPERVETLKLTKDEMGRG